MTAHPQRIMEPPRDPSRPPSELPPQIPSTTDIPDLPKEVRVDASKIAKWVLDQIENASSQREHIERLWVRTESYMEGFHYFTIDATGAWRPLPVKDGEVRATVPLIRSIYRRELGRFTENILTVDAVPRSSSNPLAFYEAQRAEIMINAWQEETNFSGVYADWASQMLYYGLSGLYRFTDPVRKQVFTEAWPAWEIYPFPWHATKDRELEGFCRLKYMPKEWIEQNIGPQAAKLAGRSGAMGSRISGSLRVGNTFGSVWSASTQDVGKVIWFWLLPTKAIPSGQLGILVENEMFGYKATDEQGSPITGSLARHKLPIELARYTEHQGSWYGMGALPSALGGQAEADRQWSKVVRSARLRDGLLFYDPEIIDQTDIFNDDLQMIPRSDMAFGGKETGFDVVPPVGVSRDVGASLATSQEFGRMAVGQDSELLFGRAEGRVESGPLGRLLNVNAQAPLSPTFRNIFRSLQNTYHEVLDLIGETWPKDKIVSTVGQYELANELNLANMETRPSTKNVILRPSPLMPAGRSEMMNLLLQLRQLPGDDGKPEITSAEFRRGLASIGMTPPGITIVSRKDQRIRQRVAELFNDGKTPGKFFFDAADRALIVLEDPKKLKEIMEEMILEPGFRASASREVKRAFLTVLKEIRTIFLDNPATDDRFDENLDLESLDSRQMEEALDAQEQNPEDFNGMFQVDGIPAGLLG